jgi:hypothetical protein
MITILLRGTGTYGSTPVYQTIVYLLSLCVAKLALVITQKCSFSKILEVVSTAVDQHLVRITNPVSNLTGD